MSVWTRRPSLSGHKRSCDLGSLLKETQVKTLLTLCFPYWPFSFIHHPFVSLPLPLYPSPICFSTLPLIIHPSILLGHYSSVPLLPPSIVFPTDSESISLVIAPILSPSLLSSQSNSRHGSQQKEGEPRAQTVALPPRRAARPRFLGPQSRQGARDLSARRERRVLTFAYQPECRQTRRHQTGKTPLRGSES